MLIDLLNSANYIMVSIDGIRIFGLTTAVYCSELLNVLKKAIKKNKLFLDGSYFKVDRAYIEKQTSLTLEQQLACDKNLAKVNIIKISAENPDIIFFDVETFASILSSQDVKVLEKVSDKVKVQHPKGVKEAKKQSIINALKESIECKTPQVLYALYDWIDAVMLVRPLSKAQVRMFKEKIDDTCNGDLEKALAIINLATIHQYVDCQWAINLYNQGNTIQSKTATPAVRTTTQKVTTINELGEEF